MVSTWMHRIVTNEALMWLRSERRRRRFHGEVGKIEDAAVADGAPGPVEQLVRREREAGLGALLRET